jgi:protein TonB
MIRYNVLFQSVRQAGAFGVIGREHRVAARPNPISRPSQRQTAALVCSILAHVLVVGLLLIGLPHELPPSPPADQAFEMVFSQPEAHPTEKMPESAPGEAEPAPPPAETAPPPVPEPLPPPTVAPQPETAPPPAETAATPVPEPLSPLKVAPEPETAPPPPPPAVTEKPVSTPPPEPPSTPQPPLTAAVQPRPRQPLRPRPAVAAPAPPVGPTAQPQTSSTPARDMQPTSAPISADWQRALAAWLAAHKAYPDEARREGREGTVELRFTIDRSGRVQQVELVNSAGSSVLDAAAQSMLRGAILPPLPPTMSQDKVTMTVRIHYRLTNERSE